MRRQHRFDRDLQGIDVRGDDAPKNHVADLLILVPVLVADRAYGRPRHFRMIGEPVAGNATDGFRNHDYGICRRTDIGRVGFEFVEGRTPTDRMEEGDLGQNVVQRDQVAFHD